MPKLFSIGQYIVFFWSNENNEPIHVHVGIGRPHPNATKLWITQSGGCVLAHNDGRIPQNALNKLIEAVSINYFYICSEWKRHFHIEQIIYYC